MENIGLKGYSKNLEVSLPIGTAHINLCPQQNNVIFEIPLIDEMGISFLFNYLCKDRNTIGTMGKGGHISLFSQLRNNRIWNADFTSDEYSLGELNAETGLTLTRVSFPPSGQDPTYELKDKNDNKIRYVNPNSFDYPTEIVDYRNEKTTYFRQNDVMTVTSKNKIAKIYFESNGRISKVEHIVNDNTTAMTINFFYQSDVIKRIVFLNARGGLLSYEFIHTNNSVELKAPMARTGRLFVFDSSSKRLTSTSIRTYAVNSVSTVIHEKQDFSFEYDTDKNITTVTDSDGRTGYYFFESRNIRGGYYNSLCVSGDGEVSTNEIKNDLKPHYEVFYNKALLSKAIFSNFSLDDFSSGQYRDYQPNQIENLLLSDSARILESNESHHDWPVNANGGDSFTLTCLAKAVNNSAEITLQLGEDEQTISVSNNWKLLCVQTNIKEYTETLHLCLEATDEVVVGAINLFRKSFATFYNYHLQGEDTASDGKCTVYNAGGLISNIVDSDGFKYSFEYDDNKDLVRFKTSNGVLVENQYDDNHQVTYQQITGQDFYHRTTKEYDEYGQLILERGDNPYAYSTYSYDQYGALERVAKATLVNQKVYNAYGDLKKIIASPFNGGGSPTLEATYTYDQLNPNLIAKIEINNGGTYTFEYDEFKRLTRLLLNGSCIFKYGYNGDSDRIFRQYFGDSSDYFEFDYYDNGEIHTATHSSGNLTYEYRHDEFGRLSEIYEHSNGNEVLLERYFYNEENEIVKAENNVKSISKVFDNNDKETRNKASFNGKEIIQEFDPVERAKGSNLEMVLDEVKQHDGYSVATFVGDNKCTGAEATYSCHYRKTKNNNTYLVESNNRYYQVFESEPMLEDNIPCVQSTNRIAFVAKGQAQSLCSQTVAFWFKTSTHKSNACLFYTRSRSGGSSLALYEYYNSHIGRYCLQVVVVDKNKKSHEVLSTLSEDLNPNYTHFELNKWNFIALTCGVELRNGYRAMVVKLKVNGIRFEKVLNQIDFQWALQDQNLEMNIGYVYVDTVETPAGEQENHIINSFDRAMFALIAIGNRKSISDSLVDEYYRRTKDYIIDNTLNGEYNTSDCSITRLVKASNSDYGTFKVFPLENNLFSLDYDPSNTYEQSEKDRPSKFDIRKGYSADRDPIFNYDKSLKKYVFIADGQKLAYKAQFNGSGTVVGSFYFEDMHRKQYIFDIKSSVTRISLLKDGEDDQLCLIIDNNGTQDTSWISGWPMDNVWHDIALSFDRRVQTGYFGSTYSHYVRVIVNGYVLFEQEFNNISLINNAEIMLGRSFTVDSSSSNDDAQGIKYNALFGRISNFAYNNAYNSTSTITGLFDKMSANISLTRFFDDVGFATKEEINKGNQVIFEKEYYHGEKIYNETFKYKNREPVTRDYSYDNLDNITYISSSDNQSFNYSYDFQGYLLEEEYYGNNRSFYRHYSYDSNGNILERTGNSINDVFTYVGDKLNTFNGTSVLYSQTSPGNIVKLGNITYEYVGRRLVKTTILKQNNGTTKEKLVVTYDYNASGLRTRKTVTEITETLDPSVFFGGSSEWVSNVKRTNTINYEYDGENLVYEKSENNELFFLYDENKQLYGYILNGKKYFYLRDIISNIIGLIDENGTVVANYVYDAYGNFFYSNSSAGLYNPIRYKGYYCDEETGMFYCKSRYYFPRICRWINMDNPGFFKMDDASKLNLFSYCHGNPVMYADPDGHMPIWLKWVIGVTAFAGAVALTVFTGGSLGPVIAGMAISIVASGLLQGAASAIKGEGFMKGLVEGMADGAFWGGIFSLASAGLRTIQLFRNGVAIGENMRRVSCLARAGGQVTYRGMPFYKTICKFGGENLARTMSMAHNQRFIERMMRWGVKIVDYGIDAARDYRSFYYLMETIVTNGYKFLILMF